MPRREAINHCVKNGNSSCKPASCPQCAATCGGCHCHPAQHGRQKQPKCTIQAAKINARCQGSCSLFQALSLTCFAAPGKSFLSFTLSVKWDVRYFVKHFDTER